MISTKEEKSTGSEENFFEKMFFGREEKLTGLEENFLSHLNLALDINNNMFCTIGISRNCELYVFYNSGIEQRNLITPMVRPNEVSMKLLTSLIQNTIRKIIGNKSYFCEDVSTDEYLLVKITVVQR